MKTKYLTYNGVTLSLEDWAAKIGIPKSSLHSRLSRAQRGLNGWTIEKVLTTPKRLQRRLYTYNGKTQSLRLWAREFGVRYDLLYRRFHQGMTVEEAFSNLRPTHVPKMHGLADFLNSRPEEVEEIKQGLFSSGEMARIAAIKNRKAGVAA